MSFVAINRLTAIKNQIRNMSTVHKIVQTNSAPAAIGPYCNVFICFSFSHFLRCILMHRGEKKHDASLFSHTPISFIWTPRLTNVVLPTLSNPLAQAIVANGFVFASGSIPVDPATGEVVPGGVKEQTVS